VVDDIWFACGSSNLNRRSWTTDSELTCAVLDPEAGLAGDLRCRLAAEHLARPADDPHLRDLASAFELWRRSAEMLDAWHHHGRVGPRPPGRARRHDPAVVSGWTWFWAAPLHRIVFDPDDRSRRRRRRDEF
jgi:phosphatidylserine/phosphatidylglycerophosphate/cardiolipin synthase-like enzyme